VGKAEPGRRKRAKGRISLVWMGWGRRWMGRMREWEWEGIDVDIKVGVDVDMYVWDMYSMHRDRREIER
jgi:hypothetical protein